MAENRHEFGFQNSRRSSSLTTQLHTHELNLRHLDVAMEFGVLIYPLRSLNDRSHQGSTYT